MKDKIINTFFELEEFPGKKFPWYKRPEVYLWRILRQYVYERDGGICAYCKNSVELINCNIHHALELSQGGTNHPTNLKILCKDCHKKRHPFMQDARDKMNYNNMENKK